MQKSEIKHIVFDVGMVLIDFCWKSYCETLGFSKEVIMKFEKNMVLSDIWNQLDQGTISLERANEIFLERMPGLEKEIALFWEKQEGMVREFDYSLPLIDKLKELGYNVYLLSNYPIDMYECHWPSFRFFQQVDGYVVSSLEKVVKPDLEIYRILCRRYELNEEECLFVDDRRDNVEAAKKLGMQGIVFNGYDAFKEEVKQMGVVL